MDLTVVVPTFGRVDALLATLSGLAQSSMAAERFEVVVVDDGSRDSTIGDVTGWIAQSRLVARLLRQQNQGPAVARNNGAREARGEILLFLDNDILTAPAFLEQHVEAIRSYPGSWIVNRVVHTGEVRLTPFGRYRDFLNRSFQAPEEGGMKEVIGATGQGWSMRREEFFAVGGFDERFEIASCEDWDLAFRAKRMGYRTLYHPGIVVEHMDWAVDLRSYGERQRLYSVSDVLLWAKYGHESPREPLVHANGPIDMREDTFRGLVVKLAKRLLALRWARSLAISLATLMERLIPDSWACWRAYRLVISLYVFTGIREGFARLEARK